MSDCNITRYEGLMLCETHGDVACIWGDTDKGPWCPIGRTEKLQAEVERLQGQVKSLTVIRDASVRECARLEAQHDALVVELSEARKNCVEHMADLARAETTGNRLWHRLTTPGEEARDE